jgi:osmoprotectant transport system permease protein
MGYILAHPGEILHQAWQHLVLVAISTGTAALLGIPLGVFLTRRPAWSRWFFGAANIIQTIPSLALFGFLIPLPFVGGIGARTAIIALILYALLPIIRNTHAGIVAVDPAIREAGRGMGMTDWQLLMEVEIPLSVGVIMTGVRIATVIGVGVATIAASVGAGGLGTYIFRGVSMVDNELILAGAIPSAVLALIADYLLGVAGYAVANDPIRRMRTLAISALALIVAGGVSWAVGSRPNVNKRPIVIGSKNFTEQNILGELLAQHLERKGFEVDRRFYLQGTMICHNALIAGQIDTYVEYTGTAYTAVLKKKPITDDTEIYRELQSAYQKDFAVQLMKPLGFNNTFAIMIRGAEARRLGLRTLSEAAAHTPEWKAGFGNEFLERADGFRGLQATYNLTFSDEPSVMDLGLTYRALADGQIDLIAGDATNGLISALDLVVLDDDKHYFPPYRAVPLVRIEALNSHPGLEAAINSLGGKLSDETMRRLNYAVDGEHRDAKQVVKEFLDAMQNH